MYVYKSKNQSDGSIEKIKMRTVLIGDLQNKEMIEDTWSTTASTKTLNYFLGYSSKHKVRVLQLYFIGEFLQADVKHTFLVKLYSRNGEYFPEHENYFGRPFIQNNSMYGMTDYVYLFSDELTNCLIDEAGFKNPQCQISIYYNYAPYVSNLVVLYYVDDCVHWCTYE